jgi:hypothetical protein
MTKAGFICWGGTAAAVGMIGSAIIGGNAAKSAANTQANAAQNQQNALLAAGQQASQQFTPYAAAGTSGLAGLANNDAYFNNQFNNQDLNAQLAPNYAWQLQQGQGAQNAAANAAGGMIGGNAQQALQQYTQNFAANAYQNAFNNYQAQRSNIYNQNMGEAQLGLQAATGSANAQLGTATNVAGLGMAAANAQAAGTIGQANAYGGALSNLGGLAYANYGNNSINADNIWNGSAGTGGFTSNNGTSFTI